MKEIYYYMSIYLMVMMFFLIPFSSHAFGEEAGKASASDLEKGKRIYSLSCILCHGSKGKGDGPASVFIGPYSHPRPNDFTRGVFKYRSTESGDLPTLADLMRTIGYGIPGYMPSFKHLGEEGIRQVALYISSTFIEDELSSMSMEALNKGEAKLMPVKNVAVPPVPKPRPNVTEAARIEVYKEITLTLNNITQNSLTAIAQKENPAPALNMYQQIVTTLNGIVSNLDTKNPSLAVEGTVVQYIEPNPAIEPIQPYANQDNAAIALENADGPSRPFMVVGIIEPEDLGNGNSEENILKTETGGAPLSTFSDLFIGDGDLIWD